jgi:aminopeptidase N
MPFITAYAKTIANADAARATIDRTPEITAYLASLFGPYPFEAQGAVVVPGYVGLENQTRPTYGDQLSGPDARQPADQVVAHEMAHQWFGNSVSIHYWRDIWLAEGFAQFAQWLWSEHAGTGTTAERTQDRYDAFPADSPFWDIVAADPGPGDNNFHTAVYYRGAFALQSLRVTVGDAVFFTILRSWAAAKRGGNATTEEFVAHAERVAGRQLDDLFQTWLYTSGKPSVSPNDPF